MQLQDQYSSSRCARCRVRQDVRCCREDVLYNSKKSLNHLPNSTHSLHSKFSSLNLMWQSLSLRITLLTASAWMTLCPKLGGLQLLQRKGAMGSRR